MTNSHAKAIDAARLASDKLLESDLTDDQRQLVVDLMNAAQDLNTAYWQRTHGLYGLEFVELVARTVYEVDHYFGVPWDEAPGLEKMLYRDRAGVTLAACRRAISE